MSDAVPSPMAQSWLWGSQASVKKENFSTGFDLTTRDSYFTILVEVFTNHILTENIFRESYRGNRTQDCGLKTCK